ncbi:hypothetical protein GX441_06875 [bacterium]|nr:hypothetical protein [bacterium]
MALYIDQVSKFDWAVNIAVDAKGNVYVTGTLWIQSRKTTTVH